MKLNFLEMYIRVFILRLFDQIVAIVHHGLNLFEGPPAALRHDVKIHFLDENDGQRPTVYSMYNITH